MFYTPKILIVDDEPQMCDSLKVLLRDHCPDIKTAHDGRGAMRCLNDIAFDLVLLDVVLPDIDGYEVMDFIHRECSDTLVIILTGFASTESAVKAMRRGACDYFNKPFEPEELVETVGNILDQKRLMRERKMAEKALAETNKFLKNILDSSSSISIISTDLEQNVLFWNKGAENIFGYTAEEIVGSQKINILYPGGEELKLVKAIRSKMMKEKKGVSCEIREITKDGRKLWINMNLTPRLDEEGHVIGILGIGEDISRRKLAEQALQESEKRYREFVEGTDDLVTRMNDKRRFIYVNHAAEKIFGINIEKLIGMSAFDFLHPEDRERTHTEFTKWIGDRLPSATIENRQVNRITGDFREMLWTINLNYDEKGHLTGINSIARDMTERKKIEDALLKAEKLNSLGTFAGGIAHDFNNLLSVILGNLSLMEDDIKPFIKTSNFLKEATKASLRARDLTTRLITFSKGGRPVKKVCSIGKLINDSVTTALSGSDVDYKLSLPDDLFPVAVDQEQMKQVIHNIVANASEAMAGEGAINVCCENVMIGEKETLPLKETKYVKLSIKDQGVGISEENLTKIFDPYFSTKEIGTEKGTGLGLAVCNSIVEKHNGFITVESEPGVETTFFIYLPASDKEIVSLKPVYKSVIEGPVTGSGRILFMDDEKMIRNFAVRMLSRIGYVTQVSKDGAEAIELYKTAKESGEPFDAVILDLTNQFGMGGKETIRKLIEIDPDVKGIVSTGYSNDPIVTDFRESGFRGVLTKPYSIDKLGKTLHEIISGEQK